MMPAKQQSEQRPSQEAQGAAQRLQDTIGRNVMEALGRPTDLHRVQVRRLWEDSYRVNIFVGANAASATVAHSFFIVADGGGNIATTNPTITKHY